MSVDGVLNIDKPAGMTSHDVVAVVRRALKTKRVGHAGTLDPDATGVLVVAVGLATRLLPYLPVEPKEYVARVVFGVSTDTEDAAGRIITEADSSGLTQEAVLSAAERFVGEIDQVPPMVSALHHEGKRLYDLARQGIVVEREPRRIVVHRLQASDFTPGPRAEATLRVVCGGGTYVRTLCADLGAAVGLPAHMRTLRREAVGIYRAADSVSVATLQVGTSEDLAQLLIAPERALEMVSVSLSDSDAVEITRGRSIVMQAGASSGDIIALLYRERLLALARRSNETLQPFRVFSGPLAPEGPGAVEVDSE